MYSMAPERARRRATLGNSNSRQKPRNMRLTNAEFIPESFRPLPSVHRQLDFSTGTLGLWNSDHFVIYYRNGRVPQPGIILLGQVTGDVSIFDRPDPVTIRIERIR